MANGESAASCRERPTSPSTEEAIQGMLSMAGLLCPSNQEEAPSPQESWWSSSEQRSLQEAAQHRLQGGQSHMDSQGNSSSEAWDNQGLPSPNAEYQYCDPSMSPPLHPSRRNAPNPPPISNQATKGAAVRLLLINVEALSAHFALKTQNDAAATVSHTEPLYFTTHTLQCH